MQIDRYMWSAELQRERQRQGLNEPPLFVVVTNSGQIDPSDRVFQRRSYPIAPMVVAPEAAEVTAGLSEVAEIVRVGAESVDLNGLVRYLAAERGVRRLVCEGGAILNYHMLTAGLVDEFFITVTPSIIGEPRPRTAVEGPAALPHDQLQQLKLISTATHGGEVFSALPRARRLSARVGRHRTAGISRSLSSGHLTRDRRMCAASVVGPCRVQYHPCRSTW